MQHTSPHSTALHHHLHYTTLHYTTLNSTALHCTATAPPPHRTALHCTALCHNYNYNNDYYSYNYNITTTTTATSTTTTTTTTLPYSYSYNCNYKILQIHCATLRHTTPHYIQQLWLRWPLQPLQKHNSNHLSVHQWICSAIHASQQLASPAVFYLWNLRHRLLRSHWKSRFLPIVIGNLNAGPNS